MYQNGHPCGWVEHVSDTGVVYFTTGEDCDVPPMPEDLLDCALYVYGSVEDADQGTASGGSGFLVGVHTAVVEPPQRKMIFLHLYAVTNWHVILGVGQSPVLRLNTRARGRDILKTQRADWKQHPQGDDLAITSITLSVESHQFNFLEPQRFLKKERMYEVAPGTETVMVGRFISHDGRQRNLPSLRFGNIAMMPLEPIRHPGGFMQESFLVETRSLSGYSGSPVFAYTQIAGEEAQPRSQSRFHAPPAVRTYGLFFIGVDWGHLPNYEKVLTRDKKTPVSPAEWVPMNSGMCGVVPAWRLAELLEDEEVKMKREQEDKKLSAEKNRAVMVLDSSTGSVIQKGHQTTADGLEIPVPTKKQFFDDLNKVNRRKKD